MTHSQVQEIKERLDIVEVISSYLKLEKTGANYRASCPFHSEKKPSFFVSPSKQIFKCFGCGAAGSVFDFVMRIEGIEFKEALSLLAKRAGVELKQVSSKELTERQRLSEILELACLFFERQLKESQKGQQALKYLKQRGISEQSVKKWRLGYAPNKWQALSDFLVGRGYQRDQIVKAGLAVESQKGGLPYDRFRSRIIFPVFSSQGQVIGFGGRVFLEEDKDEIAKYINTPATPLYDKSRTLYGLNFAKVAIRQKDRCLLVEGYVDVILAHQVGFEETVAASGTSLTEKQLKILKRYTNNLLTAFDKDRAGGLATEKGIGMAQKMDFEVRVINMPQDKDPADVIKESPEKWRTLVESAQEIMEFYLQTALQRFDKRKARGKKEIAAFFLSKVALLPNPIVRSHWVQKLAKEISIPQEVIMQELNSILQRSGTFPSFSQDFFKEEISKQESQRQRKELLEEKVLSLVLRYPEYLSNIEKSVLNFFSLPFKNALFLLKKRDIKNPQDVQEFFEEEDLSKEVKQVFVNCWMRSEVELEDDPAEEFKTCLKELKHFVLKEELKAVSRGIKEAEKNNDQIRITKLLRHFRKLTQQIYESQKQKRFQD